ncbi:MAG TPA: RidA family protein [Gemmatimonadaceae bacterium]|nr:RidA family protein [Gemmatimonadaceae bacterium]
MDVIQPDGWLAPRGYANGVSARGRVISIAGQIGWNPTTGVIESLDFARQTAQALRNVVAVLARANARPEHLVRMTWFVTDRQAYVDARVQIGDAYREIIGRHFPAMSVIIVCGLVEGDALVEIEATAVVPE